MQKKHVLKLGLPKGSLQNNTFDIFKKAGFTISAEERSYFPYIDDEEIECILIRAQEIARFVEDGTIDVGVTGKDWIMESKAHVVEIAELIYAKKGMRPVKLVLAVPKDSKIKTARDLEGKRIATEFVNITKDYLKKYGVSADVEFSWGATEVKVPKLVDAIIELTETGQSLEANNLKIIDVVMESTPRIIANKQSLIDEWKKQKIDHMVTLLEGALAAEGKVGLKMNVSVEKLKEIVGILPALRKPTVSMLNEKGWVAIEVIVNEVQARKIIPWLKKMGAEGIVEYPLNKVIL